MYGKNVGSAYLRALPDTCRITGDRDSVRAVALHEGFEILDDDHVVAGFQIAQRVAERVRLVELKAQSDEFGSSQ